jgi:uncharacterized YigZ family protein
MFLHRFARALAGLALLVGVGACAGSDLVAPAASPAAAGALAASAAGLNPQPAADARLLQSAAAPSLCLAVAGGQPGRYLRAVLAPCADVPAQQWGIEAAPASGNAPLADSGLCLDDWSARMRAGDSVGTWTCVRGAPSQQWSLTPAGEIRLSNGLCAGLAGAAAAGTPVALQTCTGAAGQLWSTRAATSATPRLLAAADNPRLCLAVSGGAAVPARRAVLAPCADGPGQRWGVAPSPTTASAPVFDGALCLDDWSARMRAGDSVGTWRCVPAAPSQQWSLTAAGEVRLGNGLCAGLTGSAAAGTAVSLQPCTGESTQKWVAPAAVEDTPVLPTGADAVFAFMGPRPSVSEQVARGGPWARYENDFAHWAELHWAWEGADNGNANFYDRALIYYVWWARTGNATYLDRAHQLAVNHRAYIEAGNYNAQPFMLMLDGVALHAILTGDAASRTAVQRMAAVYSAPGGWFANAFADPPTTTSTRARPPACSTRCSTRGTSPPPAPRATSGPPASARGSRGPSRRSARTASTRPRTSAATTSRSCRGCSTRPSCATTRRSRRTRASSRRSAARSTTCGPTTGCRRRPGFKYVSAYCNADNSDFVTADLNNLVVPASASWPGRPATRATSRRATPCSPAAWPARGSPGQAVQPAVHGVLPVPRAAVLTRPRRPPTAAARSDAAAHGRRPREIASRAGAVRVRAPAPAPRGCRGGGAAGRGSRGGPRPPRPAILRGRPPRPGAPPSDAPSDAPCDARRSWPPRTAPPPPSTACATRSRAAASSRRSPRRRRSTPRTRSSPACAPEFPDATHNCWAFVVGPPGSTGRVGMSDDGEPHGTAGRPMLTALLHSGLGDVAAVVTRYYGGTKLGTGGLVRAYGGCVAAALASAPTIERVTWVRLDAVVAYDAVSAVQQLVAAHGGRVAAETYAAEVHYALDLPEGAVDRFAAALRDATRGRARLDAGEGPAPPA